MSVGHFHIPGDATRREYAVYVMVACHRETGAMHLYVGKTGDNKEGCNPVISRAGNHFSFNKTHSQMRNKLPTTPEAYDFDFFYATFGQYVDPHESRSGIAIINEMERQLNQLIQNGHVDRLLNPYQARTRLPPHDRESRATLATPERLMALEALVAAVSEFISDHGTDAAIIVEGPVANSTSAGEEP